MKTVGAGFDGSVKNRGSRTAKLGAEVRGLHFKFLNRIYRGKHHKIRAVEEVYGV